MMSALLVFHRFTKALSVMLVRRVCYGILNVCLSVSVHVRMCVLQRLTVVRHQLSGTCQ